MTGDMTDKRGARRGRKWSWQRTVAMFLSALFSIGILVAIVLALSQN